MLLSDEVLFRRLKDGELSAFDSLYARYSRRLYGFIFSQLKQAAEAEDVLQETFIAILRENRAAPLSHSFRAWLFQVARNLCLNRMRAAGRTENAHATMTSTATADEAGADAALAERQRAAALATAVARLPHALGEMYRLRASGLSYDEVATALQIPLGTVKSRMHELVQRLKQEMPS